MTNAALLIETSFRVSTSEYVLPVLQCSRRVTFYMLSKSYQVMQMKLVGHSTAHKPRKFPKIEQYSNKTTLNNITSNQSIDRPTKGVETKTRTAHLSRSDVYIQHLQ